MHVLWNHRKFDSMGNPQRQWTVDHVHQRCIRYTFVFYFQLESQLEIGEIGPIPYTYLLQYAIIEGGTVFPLGLFCFIMSLVLFAFLGYHLWLIFWNTTTNETFKWDDYRRFTRLYVKKLKEKDSNAMDPKKRAEAKKIEEMKPPLYTLDKKGRVVVTNIYDKGFLSNLKEVFFPASLRSQSTLESKKKRK